MGQVGSPGSSSTAAPISAARIRADGLEFRIRAPRQPGLATITRKPTLRSMQFLCLSCHPRCLQFGVGGPINTLRREANVDARCWQAAADMACAAQVRSLGTDLEERGWHTGHMNHAGVDRSPAALQDGQITKRVRVYRSVY